MLKVAVAWRGLDYGELSVFSEINQVSIIPLRLGDQSPNSIDAFRRALRGDIIVLRVAGTDPRKVLSWVRTVVGPRAWSQRRAQLVMRTQDSHIHHLYESLADRAVDFWALAHAAYTQHLPGSKVILCPVSIEGLTRAEALEVSALRGVQERYDLMGVMNVYASTQRNMDALVLSTFLERQSLRIFLGSAKPTRGSSALATYQFWKSSRAAVNLPISQDFNMRNFETALAGIPVFTPRVPGAELFPELTNAVYLSGDYEAQALEINSFLTHESADVDDALSARIANEHLSNDRLYWILSQVVGRAFLKPASPLSHSSGSLPGDGDNQLHVASYRAISLILMSPISGVKRRQLSNLIPRSLRVWLAVSLPMRVLIASAARIRKAAKSFLVGLNFRFVFRSRIAGR